MTETTPLIDGRHRNFYHTMPSGFSLSKHDFTGVLFAKADLTDMDMSGCNLTGCTFRNAILVRTNFRDCFSRTKGETIEELLKQASVIEDVILPNGSMLPLAGGLPTKRK